MIFWTDEKVERLRDLAAKGFSASQICAELRATSRSAIIGKCHRLGIGLQGGVNVKRKPKPRRPRLPPLPDLPPIEPTPGLEPIEEPAPELHPALTPAERAYLTARRLSIFELRENTCKWPIGDPLHEDFHFCGADSLEGGPYCEYHSGIAYQAPEPRRRVRKPAFALVSLEAGA